MKVGTLVTLSIKDLSSYVARDIVNSGKSYIFYNPGKITKRSGDRVLVKWADDKLWLDSDQIQVVRAIAN